MSEADSTSRRRPPTIDLTAKEVETAPPDSKPEPDGAAATSAPEGPSGARTGSSSSRTAPYAIGIVIGAAGAAAIAAAFWFAGLAPVQETPAPQSAAAPPSAASAPAASSAQTVATEEISARLDRIEQALQGPPRTDAALAGRVATVEAQAKAGNDSLSGLSRRVDEVAAAAQTALAQAKAATAAADAARAAAQNVQSSTQTAAQRSDIEALESHVGALQNAMKSLDADMAQRTTSSTAGDRAMRLAIATEALRAAVERGAPFQSELAAAGTLGADPKATAQLEPFAAQGLISAAELGRELAALTPAIHRAMEPKPGNNSILTMLESHAQRLVRITPAGTSAAPAGDDPAALIARLNADAARGDIDAALAEIAKLPDEARAPAEGWANKAGARRAALAESRHIAADALAAMAKPEQR
jgi:Mitochondrial inner membrane protein